MNKTAVTPIIELLLSAGREIMKIYRQDDFGTRTKEDNSPVTLADIISDDIIKRGLGKIMPGIPVFSEETRNIDYDTRSHWNILWILDPLDGTKEFVARNDEFCISLALVLEGKPVAGFIHSPVSEETWMAVKGEGAFRIKKGKKTKLPVTDPYGPVKVNISRTHHSQAEESWIRNLEKRFKLERVIYGSAIKFCRIAEGYADIYPKFSLIHEWDIAAGHIIIEEAGGEIIETATLCPPVYNKPDYHQPPFIASGTRGKELLRMIFSEKKV